MRRLYDFQCDSGHVNEFLRDSDVEEVDCPDCGLKARKIVTPVKVNGGKDSWKETRKWARQRESHMNANKT
jgi:putative FmdB family regulatory protein